MNKDITLEDLGFSLDEPADELNYFSKKCISETDVISFNTKYKTFQAFIESDSPFTPPLPYTLSVEELQAIYNKCKELKWVD